MNKQEATRIIALTLAEMRSRPFEPLTTDWSDANFLAHKFEAAGYVKTQITTVKEFRALPVGSVFVTDDDVVGEVFGIDVLDDDGNPTVSAAVRWAGSDIYDYMDGFTGTSDHSFPVTILHTIKEG